MIFDFLGSAQKKQQAIGGVKPTVLLILDGWGIAPASPGNAITQAKTPNMTKLYSQFPHGELSASGESVGLPANEVGNTEVGHLNLGAGRLILQDLKKISKSIEDGSFFYNKALRDLSHHVKKFNSRLHIMGLVGSGHVHSSLDHLYGCLDFAKKEGITKVYLHLFTDGRDSPPKEGVEIIAKVEEYVRTIGLGQIATVSGRYWAMDRDGRWDRTRKAYDAIVAARGLPATSATAAVQASYNAGKTDEFVEPSVIAKNGLSTATVGDNDAVIFFNFRIDRPRQLTMAFTLPNFETIKSFDFGKDPEKGGRLVGEVKFEATFKREKRPQNLFFVTMTEYQKTLPVSAVAFPPEVIEKSFSSVLSELNLKQMHISESEKERFITYYFDGLREGKLPNEEVVIVPSPRVATYDKKPEMSLYGVREELKKALSKGIYNFLAVNFANPDMVAHTGNLKATIAAVEHVDKAIGEVLEEVLLHDGTLVITADHGNAEELLSYKATSYFFTTATGEVNTDHSNYPVPLVIAGKQFYGQNKVLPKGTLGDVAPTLLSLMGIQIPSMMTGKNLLA